MCVWCVIDCVGEPSVGVTVCVPVGHAGVWLHNGGCGPRPYLPDQVPLWHPSPTLQWPIQDHLCESRAVRRCFYAMERLSCKYEHRETFEFGV